MFLPFICPSVISYIRPLPFLMSVLILQSCLVHLDTSFIITVHPSFMLSAASPVNKWRDIHVLIPDTQQSVRSSRPKRPLPNESCALRRPLKRVRHSCYVAIISYCSMTTRAHTPLTVPCSLIRYTMKLLNFSPWINLLNF